MVKLLLARAARRYVLPGLQQLLVPLLAALALLGLVGFSFIFAGVGSSSPPPQFAQGAAQQGGCLPAGAAAQPVSVTTRGLRRVAGMSAEQMANAATIVAVAQRLHVPERGWLVAVEVARQESELLNLDHGPGTSLGAYQQKSGWGPPEDRTNLVQATTMFLTGGAQGQDGLLDVQGWQGVRLADAGEAVQHSGQPEAYAQWDTDAAAIVAEVTGKATVAVQVPECPAVEQVADTGGLDTRKAGGHRDTSGLRCPVGAGRVELAPGGVRTRICDVPTHVRGGLTIPYNALRATNALRMFDAAAREGIILGGSGWRSNVRQQQLFAHNCGARGCHPPTAVPGTSEHEWGLAGDLTCNSAQAIPSHTSRCWVWLNAHAAHYGFYNLKSEPWHWSIDGT